MKKTVMKNRHIQILRKYIIILLGAFLMGVGVNLVYEPMGLVTGGVSGLAIVVKHWTGGLLDGGVPVWLFNVLCNVPLFLLAMKAKGVRFLFSSLFGMLAFTLSLMVVPVHGFLLEDYLLASIFGGVISGAGIGLVFSVQSSTGGTDLLATLLHFRSRHISVPRMLILIDGIIILLGAIVFGLGNALYAVIAVFITGKVSDGILEGLKFAKMAYIISDRYSEIANAVMHQMDRGITGINATGMYSNRDKKMLFCVVSQKEIVRIVEISKKIDPNSFIIVSDVREVMGEGFIEYRQ
ncbi:uncharacterized membrane-anchored protein YitT (DUF2179 family) [Anaerotaenia torta]|uniref:YitT family protein n=1 Tax=Anaerotaenia torta TaxID=433293 RepID=UPI003D2022D8